MVALRQDLPLLRELLGRVAGRTLRFDMSEWFWGDAIACDGLLEAAELLDRPNLSEPVRRWLGRWAERFLRGGPRFTDHLTPGAALVRLAVRDEDERMLESARRLGSYLQEEVPRSHPTGAPLYRPDDPGYRNTVWVDTLYHEPMFFAALHRATGEQRYAHMCLDVVRRHWAVLYDSASGLLPQAVNTATDAVRGRGWARGQGWAVLGLADCLGVLPPGHAEEIRAMLLPLITRIASLQDASGFWHTLIHDRDSYLETSTATFFGATLLRLDRLGILAAGPVADRALAAGMSRIDGEGAVWGVSAVTWAATTPVGDADRYKSVPTEFNLWGQGSALRMLSEAIRSAARTSP